jgi:hypothetical protein
MATFTSLFWVMATSLAGVSAASAQPLTEEQARAIIAPWYSLFNVAARGDVRGIQERVLTPDYESCSGYLPSECWGRETSIKVVSNFTNGPATAGLLTPPSARWTRSYMT